MKLRNKKTGEIIDVYKGEALIHYNNGRNTMHFKSLKDLEEWEDYEEPKEYWYVGYKNIVRNAERKFRSDYADNDITEKRKEIGNYFETKEEAENALEKLKAWKRLRDKGFKFKTWGWENKKDNEYTIWFELSDKGGDCSDLDLLFGEEE